ncbi:MAG: hypothetical protein M5R41_08975 [Bacteroidia bacterium]|nr:hypothetical protein [Bacteroidia bacterium]
MPWTHIATVFEYQNTRWSIALELPGNDQLYYLVAVQENPSPHVDWYLSSPRFVMSPAAANIFHNIEAGRKLTAPDTVSFDPLACDTARVDTLVIRNGAESPLLIREIEVFGGDGFYIPEAERSTPWTIPAQGTMMIFLRPANARRPAGSYVDTLRLHTDDLSLPVFSHDIIVKGQIDSFSVAFEQAELHFGTVDMCGGRMSFADAVVHNDGTQVLWLEAPDISDPDVRLEEPGPVEFPLQLSPGQRQRLRYVLAPSMYRGHVSGHTTLRAYAVSCSAELLLPFTAETDTAFLEVENELAFGALTPSQFPAQRRFQLTNPSDRVIRIQRADIGPGSPFRVQSISDSTLFPAKSASVVIESVDPLDAGLYEAVLTIVTSSICADRNVLLSLRRIPRSARLRVEDAAGSAGDTVLLRVVTEIEDPAMVESIIRVRAMLNVPTSLLVPIMAPFGAVDGEVRRIPLSMEIPALAADHVSVYPFLVTLGFAESAVLALSEVTIEGQETEIHLKDGLFHLDGVCREGGNRLFDGRVRSGIESVYPNPAQSFTVITCAAIERGIHSLALHDALGRRLSVIDESYREPGQFTITFPTTALHDGAYMLLLTTPSRQHAKPFLNAR